MTKDKALKLALEALESGVKTQNGRLDWIEYDSELVEQAITAIKETLANEALEKMAENARELGLDYEPEQEPVGEIVDAIEGAFKCSFTKMLPVGTKLYTTPPQRKPLTDEEIYKASTEAKMQEHYMGFHSGFIRFARAIEAKLRSKNESKN